MVLRPLPACVVAALSVACHPGVRPSAVAPQPRAPRPWQATDYYRLVSPSEPQVSPDGRWVVFTVTTVVEAADRRHSELWIAPLDGSGPPTRLTRATVEASHPVWSPDGRTVAYSDSGGKTWFQPVASRDTAYRVGGVRGRPLYSPTGGTIVFGWRGVEGEGPEPWLARVSAKAITRGPDPRRFDGRVYVSLPMVADERGSLAPRESWHPIHLYLVPTNLGPTARGEPRQLTSGPLSQVNADWAPDGGAIAFEQDSTELDEVRDEPRPHLYVLSLVDGSVRGLATDYAENRSPAWSPDGQWLAFVCSRGRGAKNDVCVMPAGGGRTRNLTASWDREPFPPRWSGDSKTVYFSAETQGDMHVFAASVEGGPVGQVTTGDRQLEGFAVSPDGRALVYPASDIMHPAELYVAPLAGGKAGTERRLTSFNDSLVAQLVVLPADTFWFASVGNLRIEAWLMRPANYQPGQRHPLILYVHGGPHWNFGNVFFPEFQMLAGQGYWVLLVNPRGSSGYGHAFTFATRGRWGLEDYQDLMKALDLAIARGGVDSTRLGVAGGSYGGFMTNWILGHTNRFAAAETDRSIYNFFSWYGSSDAQALTDYEFFGPPWRADSLYHALSPMSYAERMRTPLLIVHSEDDRRTPITDAEQLFVMLRSRGVPAEFVRYPRSYHGLSRNGPPWLLVDRLERIRTWFAHWFGSGDGTPAVGALK